MEAQMLQLALASAVLVVTAAAAQAPPPPVSEVPQRAPNNDPNQVVCEVEKNVQSRLASRRVCRTRADWADRRDASRQFTDKMQSPAPN